MPYFISNTEPECQNWAMIKRLENGSYEVVGCHETKQQAINHMVAASLAEDITPGGERLLPDNYRPASSQDVPEGRYCSNCVYYVNGLCKLWNEQVRDDYYCNKWEAKAEELMEEAQLIERAQPNDLKVGDYVAWDSSGGTARGEIVEIVRDGSINVPNSSVTINGTPDNPAALIKIYKEVENGEYEDTDILVGHKFSTLSKIAPLPEYEEEDEEENTNPFIYESDTEEEDESGRAVDLSAPSYMRSAARRGLKYYEDGLGGDGLVPATISAARDMASGNVSEAKWRKIGPWIARHLVDLDAPKNNNPSDKEYPGAGLVAHLLWGSGPSKRAAERTMNYAMGLVERIDKDREDRKYASINVNLLHEEKEKAVTKVERRVKNDVDFELRIDGEQDGMRFTGYAAVFNKDSEPLPFVERIAPGAFNKSLRSRNEVKMFMNHNMDMVLASTRSKTLKLREDSQGLLAEAILPDTTAGRDLSVLMKRGDVHSMSFGFSVPKDGDSWSKDGRKRELNEIRLHEVSVVTGFPAYPDTSATIRTIDYLANRTNVDPDKLSDAIMALENGEKLSGDSASLIVEVVNKLREDKPNTEDLLALKRKQLELLGKVL
jgi:HK97 family phage prohead protease